MKRTDITELFPEASKEAIDKLMAINGADVNSAKGNLGTLTAELEATKSELSKLKASKPAEQPDELKQATEAIAALRKELDGMKSAETARTMREKVAASKKIPAALLTGDTEDACNAQADAILAFAKDNGGGYPAVRDAGESAGAGAASKTRDKFAEWAKDNF